MATELQDNQARAHKKRARPSPSQHSDRRDDLEEERRRYEKRARHKTREDKYEPHRGGASRRKPVVDVSEPKDKKPDDKRRRKKPALATAGDLLDKFSSDAIHNDRLTVGLFL
jgi:hypothetical protein